VLNKKFLMMVTGMMQMKTNTRLLLNKRMLIKISLKTMLIQLLETKVMGLKTFLWRKYSQDQGNHRILDA
jgi:hypothetical protein